MTRRLISALLAAGLLPLAAAPAVAASPDRSQPAPRAAAQVRVLGTTSPFSPNGDGHHDRVAVRYRLTDDARVSVEVKHRGKTVLRTAPKATHAGKRSFRWDGTRANGKHVADGRYRVVVRASAHGTTHTDATAVVLRAKPTRVGAGTLKLSSKTVYPYAKVIDDVVVGNVHLARSTGANASEESFQAARAQVLDRFGHVIVVEPVTLTNPRAANGMDSPVSCGPCGRFTWDGRDSHGVRQAPGTYRIRVIRGRDSAGNVRLLTGTRAVTVSRQQLEEHTTVQDLLASEAPRSGPPPSGCIGCDFVNCPPGSSTRFPGGMTFDLTPPRCEYSTAIYTAPVPGRRTPYDRFAVTATGGPSTEGASASAELLNQLGPDRSTYAMNGDATTATDTVLMWANSEVYATEWPPAVVWEVQGKTGSYDIASFKVEIHTYVPAA
jgi:flagellar hook assembly protein FlgD